MWLLAIVFLLFLIALRCFYLIVAIFRGNSAGLKAEKRLTLGKVKSMIVMGSGGHTSEMLRITSHLDRERYTPRIYIVASTDTTTLSKVLGSENHSEDYTICKIPRSREVKQSYLTSIYTTFLSILFSLPVVFHHRPQLVLCNGPGVCIPICLVVFLAKALFLVDTKIVFVESLCRVKSLSLTGKILMFLADKVLVQWPDLCKTYKRADYIGHL